MIFVISHMRLKIGFVLLLLLFGVGSIPAQTIAEALKNGEPLKMEWVQQWHLEKGGSAVGNYPLFPDQMEVGEGEIRVGLILSSVSSGTIAAKIEYISYIQFPEATRESSADGRPRSTQPAIVDTRFQDEYFNSYLFVFNLMVGQSIPLECGEGSIRQFLADFEERLEKAIKSPELDDRQRGRVRRRSLPDNFSPEAWAYFSCALKDVDLPHDEQFHQLPLRRTATRIVSDFFRLDYPARRSVLRGNIQQPVLSEVSLKFYQQGNWLEYWQDTLIKLTQEGDFQISFPLDQPQMISLRHGYKTMRFFLNPGDSLSFTTAGNAFYRQMELGGNAKMNNDFLLDFYHEMRGDTLFQSYDYHLLEKEQLSYLEKHVREEAEELQFLDQRKAELSSTFAAYMDRLIRLHFAGITWEAAYRFSIERGDELNPSFSLRAEQLGALLYRLPRQRTFDFDTEQFLRFKFFQLNGYFVNSNLVGEDDYFLSKLLLSEETRVRHLGMRLFRSYGEEQNLSNYDLQILAKLLSTCRDSSRIKELLVFTQAGNPKREMKGHRILINGEKAPDWSFTDLEGVEISLHDFKGKKLLLHIGWSQNLETAMEDIRSFEENQDHIPEIVHLIHAANKSDFTTTTKNKEGLFIYVPHEEMLVLQESYRIDNNGNHYYLIDEMGNVLANHLDLSTPTRMRGIWNKLAKPKTTAGWSAAQRLSFWKGLGIGAIALLLLSGVFLWQRQVTARRDLRRRQLLEFELKGIRSQMNPHFLFNAMSSIQNLIRKKEQEKADLYLSRFAGLMRRTLRNTAEEYIPLSEELETLRQYCSLEALRQPFHFSITVAEEIDQQNTYIPSMILQPILENAILHGLGPQKGERKLWLMINLTPEGLRSEVTDNGIGILAAQTYTTARSDERKSYGMKLVKQRLDLLSNTTEQSLEIIDRSSLDPALSGTRVTLIIPTEQ